MNSFEQIKLEKETKEKLDEYQKYGSQEEVARLKDLRQKYGEKTPGEIGFWKAIWDGFNMDYDSGIPEQYIPHTAMEVLGLSRNKGNEIAKTGVEFGLLIEAKSENVGDLEFIDDISEETIYRLILPEERPDLYIENPKQYAERETWAPIWEDAYEDNKKIINRNILKTLSKKLLNIETDTEFEAAIEIGVMSSAIRQTENGFVITSERPKEYWLEVWELSAIALGEPAPKSDIVDAVVAKTGNISDAVEIVSEAIERGEIYSPKDAPDNHYTINDPATDSGPEIDKGSDSTDDGDGGGKGGQSQNIDDDSGDSPSGRDGTTQPSQTESPPSPTNTSDDGTTADAEPTADTNGQTTNAANRKEANTQTEQTTQGEECEEKEGENSTDPTTTTEDDGSDTAESPLATSKTVDSTDDSAGSDSTTNQDISNSDGKSTFQDSEITQPDDDAPVVKSPSEDNSGKNVDDNEDVDPIKQRHNANRQSEDELDVATDVEEGVNLNEVEKELNSDGSHDKFRTYEETEVDDEEYDPDREAVKQFVAGFCIADEDRKDELKMSKNQIFNAFTTWAEINQLELDELSEDVYEDMRKGNLNNVLTDLFNVKEDRMDIDGKRVRAVAGIELSDIGYELLDVNYTE